MTQILISKYYKTTSSTQLKMSKGDIGKRKASEAILTSTPIMKNTDINDVISLVSDSEEELLPGTVETESSHCIDPLMNVECITNESQSSLSSSKTIIYETPQTPTKPLDTPKSNSSQSSGCRYSPYKKRMVPKRSPVRQNLALDLCDRYPTQLEQGDQDISDMFKDIDDNTNFLRQMIIKYLNTSELRNLLDKNSQELLSRSVDLGVSSVRLVCRLYWRKISWYKRDKLAGIAIGKQAINACKIQDTLEELVKRGFITQAEGKDSLSFDDCKSLLQKKQCKEICKSLSLKCCDATKDGAIRALNNYSRSKSIETYFIKSAASNRLSNAEHLLKLMREKLGSYYRLSDLARETLNKLYLLMYLGMDYTVIREKKLEFTLLNDKNKIETYPIDKGMNLDNASVVFKSQIEFERYYEAHNDYENFLMQTDSKEKSKFIQIVFEKYKSLGSEEMKSYKVLPMWLRRFTPAYLYIRIIGDGIVDLKREEKYQLAIDILSTLVGQNAFRQHKKGEWYAEMALILHKCIRQYDMAGKVLLEGLKSDIPKALKQGLLLRAKQLVNQKNITLGESVAEQLLSAVSNDPPITEKDFDAEHVYKQHMDREGKGKKRFITRTADEFTAQNAEDFCISNYINKGLFTNGRHWEGSMVTTIFTLLFWDIIYMKLRGYCGIFMSPYQVYPLDMFCPSFYENRREIIEERLIWIENSSAETLREEMRKVWDSRPESEISGINRSLGWDHVLQVCECAGARHLASLCRRLALNYVYTHSGFPDLTLWNTNTKQVKTDTDKPSIKQLQWMQYLKSVGIDTGFCYVGVNTERGTARAGRGEPQSSQSQ